MLPVVFEKFEMVYTFLLLFSFQMVNFSKSLGGLQSPQPYGFYGPAKPVCFKFKEKSRVRSSTEIAVSQSRRNLEDVWVNQLGVP